MCTLCNSEPETILHLFCNCPEIQELLSIVKAWLNEIEHGNLLFDDKSLLFSTVHKNPKNVCNVIVLIFKHYIYVKRCFGSKINLVEFKECLLYHNRMEFLGAVIKGKQNKCLAKWHLALEVIQKN